MVLESDGFRVLEFRVLTVLLSSSCHFVMVCGDRGPDR